MKKQNGNGKDSNQGFELDASIAEKIAGMRSVTPNFYAHRVEVDGKPNPIAGYVMGKRPVKYKDGREGFQFVILTTAPAVLWNGDEDEPFTAPVGTAALVSERAALSELNRYLPTLENGEWAYLSEVVIQPLKKVPIKGGKTMWKFAIYGKNIPASEAVVALLAPPASATPSVALLSAGSSQDDEAQDEIPF